jgi:flagellar biosynthesis protein FliQ
MDGAAGVRLHGREPHGSRGGTQGRVRAMTVDQASELIRETLLVAMIIGAPLLLIGLAVGLVISLIQAVTQIQEQSLSFIPKTAAMLFAAILLMPWVANHLMEYATRMFSGG